MLIPRFTLRTVLWAMTACAVLSFVLAQAWQGAVWAIAWAAAIGSLLLAAALYAFVFLFAFALSSLVGLFSRRTPSSSPFATNQLPPQLVTPIDSD